MGNSSVSASKARAEVRSPHGKEPGLTVGPISPDPVQCGPPSTLVSYCRRNKRPRCSGLASMRSSLPCRRAGVPQNEGAGRALPLGAAREGRPLLIHGAGRTHRPAAGDPGCRGPASLLVGSWGPSQLPGHPAPLPPLHGSRGDSVPHPANLSLPPHLFTTPLCCSSTFKDS